MMMRAVFLVEKSLIFLLPNCAVEFQKKVKIGMDWIGLGT